MEFDLYALSTRLGDVPGLAADAEATGVSTLWFAESAHNPYLACAAAALRTSSLGVGTDVAVAFPRSPMVTAQLAWDLADASDGRFVLGLGSQVKAHVVRRFSSEWSRPAARLREYVLAVRACWASFQGAAPLAFEGEFYRLSLLTEFFSAGAIAMPDVPVYIAGVNTGMATVAGEVCDGFHAHPLHSPAYLAEVVRPAINRGAAAAGRDASDVSLAVPVFVIVADSPDAQDRQRASVRRQIAFYGSTPSYRALFEHHGWADVADELTRRQRQRDTTGMAACIDDDMLDAFSVTAGWSDLGAALVERYQGIADRVFPYGLVEWRDPDTRRRWAEVAATVRAA